MRADKVKLSHRVYLGPDKPLAEVLEVEHDGDMVALRLRQAGADRRTSGVWVAMGKTANLPVRWRKNWGANGEAKQPHD